MENRKWKKLGYLYLCIEVTRRCNLKCAHCMRGEAQNHTISKEVIDALLEEVTCVKTLVLTGGEPFLEPEIIDYICNEIIRRRIPVFSINVTTNGTILDEKIAASLNRFADWIAETYGKVLSKKALRSIVQIRISQDAYHNNVDTAAALNFYRKILNKHSIITREFTKPENDSVLMMGNALKNREMLEQSGVKTRWKVAPYRVDMVKDSDTIATMIQIGWDGKVLIGEDSSYEQQDTYNYGNILEKPFAQLFVEGAFREPLTEVEADIYDKIYTQAQKKDHNHYLDQLLEVFREVADVRSRLEYVYPDLSWEELVEAAYDELNIIWWKEYGEQPAIPLLDNPKEYFEKSLIRSESDKRKRYFLQALRDDSFFRRREKAMRKGEASPMRLKETNLNPETKNKTEIE